MYVLASSGENLHSMAAVRPGSMQPFGVKHSNIAWL